MSSHNADPQATSGNRFNRVARAGMAAGMLITSIIGLDACLGDDPSCVVVGSAPLSLNVGNTVRAATTIEVGSPPVGNTLVSIDATNERFVRSGTPNAPNMPVVIEACGVSKSELPAVRRRVAQLNNN